MKRLKCDGCKYRDVVDKKWWGDTTVVCTYKSPMGKAILPTGNRPKWCYGYVKKENEMENDFIEIPIKLIEGGRMPEKKTEGASCFDCYARVDCNTVFVPMGHRVKVALGFSLELPDGYEAVIRPRSGLSSIGVDCKIGTIDSDYRGEVCAIISNVACMDLAIKDGDRICQMKIQKSDRFKLVEKKELTETLRGSNGFGSTGR